MEQTARRKPIVERVSVQKSYDVLAGQLRDRILTGEIAVGTRLPSERELVELSGLSRGSVREAVRMLEVEGLVQSRPGRYGGIVVTQPDKKSMARFVGQFVQSRRLPLRMIQEARETIEPALARLAAENRSEEELAQLRALNDALGDPNLDREAFARLNLQWHSTIAVASRNDLLSALLYAMSHGVFAQTIDDAYDNPEIRAAVFRAHGRVVEAIAARDGAAAQRRMERHVVATRAMGRDDGRSELSLDPPGPD
ncbi:DNA-binding transcriptional regulator, FadR family [Tistlia consotensis]|uniref:DNA-binding transcriptional regulator, FadR family n=1 Tax=Tistlia consotensis USBA 355 TaxID=560819 RepID=A0A1Y6CI28_9PROT|nr:FCD domain-containing protein [Tistlia consotensis]SMF65767.1 DNA-binding transcriptional regulator, FadR family [Tistlia consotensis USBA 355]SNS03197.1 DNA-binding transcriptional regulator, FadR family [Tistlia consotensis]